MKKKTNKILWTCVAACSLLALILFTIDFQVQYHKNPKSLNINTRYADIMKADADSTEIVVIDSSINQ